MSKSVEFSTETRSKKRERQHRESEAEEQELFEGFEESIDLETDETNMEGVQIFEEVAVVETETNDRLGTSEVRTEESVETDKLSNIVTVMSTNMQTLIAAINNINTRFNEQNNKFDNLKTDLNQIDSKFENLNNNICKELGSLKSEIQAEMKLNINNLDKKYNSIELKVKNINDKISNIDAKFGDQFKQIESNVNAVQISIETDMNSKVDKISNNIQEVELKFDNKLAKVTQKTNKTEKDLEAMIQNLEDIHVRVETQVENKLTEENQNIQQAVNEINEQLHSEYFSKQAELEAETRKLKEEILPRIIQIERQSISGAAKIVLEREREIPRFNGEESNPMESLRRITEWMRNKYDQIQNWSRMRSQLDDILIGSARIWWNVVRNTVIDWVDFEKQFKNKFWNDIRQSKDKDDIEFGKYDVKCRISRCDYFLQKYSILTNLCVTLTEAEKVMKIATHFEDQIRDTCEVQRIDNMEGMQRILSRYDVVNTGIRTERVVPRYIPPLNNYQIKTEYPNRPNNNYPRFQPDNFKNNRNIPPKYREYRDRNMDYWENFRNDNNYRGQLQSNNNYNRNYNGNNNNYGNRNFNRNPNNNNYYYRNNNTSPNRYNPPNQYSPRLNNNHDINRNSQDARRTQIFHNQNQERGREPNINVVRMIEEPSEETPVPMSQTNNRCAEN